MWEFSDAAAKVSAVAAKVSATIAASTMDISRRRYLSVRI